MKIGRTSASIFGLVGLVGLVALTPGQAFAQDSDAAAADSGVIIVTAQRRAEAQVDVPISITNLSSDALKTSSIQQLGDIGKVTPALRFDFSGGFFQPTIRGIGTAVVTSGGGGNVGIYVDGFYSPNPLAADFDLLSVDSIQVLKGPQGTLFGRNTTGGAILISTREPSTAANSFEGRVRYGRFNEAQADGMANYVISDRVALGIEGQYRRGDGWQHDISHNNKRVGDYENWSVRLSMKADLSDNVSVLLRYKHGKVDDPSSVLAASYSDSQIGLGAPALFVGIPGSYTTDRNHVASGPVPEYFHSSSDVLQGTIKADLGFADLTSYSQYRNEKTRSSLDLDYAGGPAEIFQLGLPNNNKTWSQEFLLTSKAGKRLQWTAGLFYFQNTDQYVTYINNGGNSSAQSIRFGGSSTTVKSYAAFLDATYELVPDRLFVTAGARYARDKVDDAYFNTRFLAPFLDLNSNGVQDPGEPNAPGGRVYMKDFNPAAVDFAKSDRVTPRVVIRYKPDEHSSIYASYTKGYKAALIDVGGSCQNAPFQCTRVRPETINAYEAGFKYEVPGFSMEGAGFYYDYKDLQVSIYEKGQASIINAAKSEIYGLEGSIHYKPVPALQLNAGASWVHARYKSFQSAPVYTRCSLSVPCGPGETFAVVPTQLNDVTMQRAPQFTGFIGARYATDVAGGELALSGNLSYSSSFFFGPSGVQFRQGGYENLSLRAQWSAPNDRWYLAVYGDNVTSSRYLTAVEYQTFGIGASWSKPTTFGGEIGVKF